MANGQSPRQDRSRKRREALLRATIELLGESGVKSVTHRAVAERAGVARALGAREPEVTAEAFVALLDGFALHRLARPRDPAREAASLVGAMRVLFLEQVMDPAARDVLHARLREPLADARSVPPSG